MRSSDSGGSASGSMLRHTPSGSVKARPNTTPITSIRIVPKHNHQNNDGLLSSSMAGSAHQLGSLHASAQLIPLGGDEEGYHARQQRSRYSTDEVIEEEDSVVVDDDEHEERRRGGGSGGPSSLLRRPSVGGDGTTDQTYSDDEFYEQTPQKLHLNGGPSPGGGAAHHRFPFDAASPDVMLPITTTRIDTGHHKNSSNIVGVPTRKKNSVDATTGAPTTQVTSNRVANREPTPLRKTDAMTTGMGKKSSGAAANVEKKQRQPSQGGKPERRPVTADPALELSPQALKMIPAVVAPKANIGGTGSRRNSGASDKSTPRPAPSHAAAAPAATAAKNRPAVTAEEKNAPAAAPSPSLLLQPAPSPVPAINRKSAHTSNETTTTTTKLPQPQQPAQLSTPMPTPVPAVDVASKKLRVKISHRALIGKGSFGVVYQAMDRDTNHIIACKEICLVKGSNAVDQLPFIKQELAMLKQLDHPNIVKCLGEDCDDKFLRIYMEFVTGGSISSILRMFGSLQEKQASNFTKQMLDGLLYLHERHICHRDLKGDNLLVDTQGVLKLADFGTAKELASQAMTVAGTAYFMAPEVIQGVGHGVEADVWSVGCCVIEMLTGKPPFSHMKNQYAIMMHIAEQSKSLDDIVPTNITSSCRSFLMRCLIRNPAERATVKELLQHDWILHPPEPQDGDENRLLDTGSIQMAGQRSILEARETMRHEEELQQHSGGAAAGGAPSQEVAVAALPPRQEMDSDEGSHAHSLNPMDLGNEDDAFS